MINIMLMTGNTVNKGLAFLRAREIPAFQIPYHATAMPLHDLFSDLLVISGWVG
jgi:hypothetical protein